MIHQGRAIFGPLLRLPRFSKNGFHAIDRVGRERMASAFAPDLHTGRVAKGWQQVRAKHTSRFWRARLSGAPRVEARAVDLSPGVLRLNLGAALEEKLMEMGQAHGPLAVYDHLVSSSPGGAGRRALQGDVAESGRRPSGAAS